jgi:hypothetical protein
MVAREAYLTHAVATGSKAYAVVVRGSKHHPPMQTGGDKETNADDKTADTTNRRGEATSGGSVQVCPMSVDDNQDPENRKA